MRTRVVATAAAVVSSLLAGPGPARAEPAEFSGELCGLTSLADPSGHGTEVGEVDAGPIVVSAGGFARARCSIHVGRDNARYDAPPAAEVESSDQHGNVVLLPPLAVTYLATPADDVYVCTTIVATSGVWYFDALTGEWTADPSATCDLATYTETPGTGLVFVGNTRSGNNGKGAKRDHRRTTSGGTTQPALPPYVPSGTVEISSVVPGSVNYAYTGFDPPLPEWACVESSTSVTCVPPPPGAGYDGNVCAVLRVDVTNNSLGSVSGASECTAGPLAQATSIGPTNDPSSGSAGAYDDFPWTCRASLAQAVDGPWFVKCTVGS